MEDYTRKFNAAKEKDEEIHHILTSVYTALEEKGYNLSTSSWATSFRRTPPTSPTTGRHAR